MTHWWNLHMIQISKDIIYIRVIVLNWYSELYNTYWSRYQKGRWIKNAKFCSGLKVVPWIKIFVLPDFWKVAQRKLDFKVLSNFCSCTMKKIHNWSVVDFHVFVKLRVLVIFNLNCIIMYRMDTIRMTF